MPSPRPFAQVRGEDPWLRCSHDGTALLDGAVQLSWKDDETAGEAPVPPPELGGGLAFDAYCRLYRSLPAEGRIERLLWKSEDPLAPTAGQPEPVDLFAAATPAVGEFGLAGERSTALRTPRGLAIDEMQRLMVAESGARRILIYDLWSGRLLRRVRTQGAPVDLAAHGRAVYAVTVDPNELYKLDARRGPTRIDLPEGVERPTRISVAPDGRLFLLDRAGSPDARIVPLESGSPVIAAAHAGDIEFYETAVERGRSVRPTVTVVASRGPNADFLRFRLESGAELPPLKGRGYDGLGIVRTPDDRIGFWTSRGFRQAVAARVRYRTQGSVTTFRLDSDTFQTAWGRIFLEACLPDGTSAKIHAFATDDPPAGAQLIRQLPERRSLGAVTPELSPPMPPCALLPTNDCTAVADSPFGRRPHRRESGSEIPWVRPEPSDAFETYEAPAQSGRGRYLWVTLVLEGDSRSTPRVRAVRAEYPTHDYLRRLPLAFSREPASASFLDRYLAMFEGFLGELEGESDRRHTLLDPRSIPEEALPWLGGFVGLAMDQRWSAEVRRRLIDEAIWLFRFRGTVRGLTRFLDIVLDVQVLLIEKFRLRGLGEPLLGEAGPAQSRAVLGAGFRIGGAIGEPESSPLSGSVDDAFRTHAHRFSVVIPALLDAEELDAVRRVLDLHRPAHTLFDICTVDAGMRVGAGLHVGLSSIIGRSGGFRSWQVGGSPVGVDAVLGRRQEGTSLGNSRLGSDSRVG